VRIIRMKILRGCIKTREQASSCMIASTLGLKHSTILSRAGKQHRQKAKKMKNILLSVFVSCLRYSRVRSMEASTSVFVVLRFVLIFSNEQTWKIFIACFLFRMNFSSTARPNHFDVIQKRLQITCTINPHVGLFDNLNFPINDAIATTTRPSKSLSIQCKIVFCLISQKNVRRKQTRGSSASEDYLVTNLTPFHHQKLFVLSVDEN
jgi:hypothetical protein